MGSVDSQQSEANDLHVTMVKIILAAEKRTKLCWRIVKAKEEKKKAKAMMSLLKILMLVLGKICIHSTGVRTRRFVKSVDMDYGPPMKA